MSMTSKVSPVEGSDCCCAEITITLDQLHEEARAFILQLRAAGVSPVGLHFEDFVPAVLRRRMDNLTIEAQRLGIVLLGSPWMELDEEIHEGEDPYIRFLFPDATNAAAFKIALL